MSGWWLVLTLSVASATASVPPASAQPREVAQPAATTEAAGTASRIAERQVVRFAVRRAELAKRYQDELDAIDRLKNQRASWRRDRELRDSLSSSLETANQLSAATRELERAKASLASMRRAYLAAIDAELSAGVGTRGGITRTVQLKRTKATLVPQVKDAPRHIVIPDLEVDPLADPEELDQRAAELRETEDELTRQLAGLGAQSSELDRLALLRKQHERAGDLVNRDDSQPHRNAPHKSETAGDESPGDSTRPEVPPGSSPTLENYVPIVLSEVIDASTITSLSTAQRSSDPGQRAEAARRAHDAVARRLEQVRKRRTEIEARAHALRKR